MGHDTLGGLYFFSIIFGWIISKLAGNILRITTRCICYVLFMFKHRACASAGVRAHVESAHGYLWTYSLQIVLKDTTCGHNLNGLRTYIDHALRMDSPQMW
jgi:hypothetical protein